MNDLTILKYVHLGTEWFGFVSIKGKQGSGMSFKLRSTCLFNNQYMHAFLKLSAF